VIDETCALAAVVVEVPTKLEGAWRVKEQELERHAGPARSFAKERWHVWKP
jgi:hypothetical protein